MSAAAVAESQPTAATDLDYDAIAIGAGLSGPYQLIKLRAQGFRARAGGSLPLSPRAVLH